MKRLYFKYLLLLFLPVFALADGTIPSIPKTPAINTSIPACLIHGEKQSQLKQLLDQRRPNHFKHQNNGEVKKFIEKQDSLLSFGIRSLKDLCEEIQKAENTIVYDVAKTVNTCTALQSKIDLNKNYIQELLSVKGPLYGTPFGRVPQQFLKIEPTTREAKRSASRIAVEYQKRLNRLTGESFEAIQPSKARRLPRDITKQEIIHIYSDYASELREFHKAREKKFAVPAPEHRNAPLAQILYMMTDSIVYLHNRIQPLKSEVYKTESILKTRTDCKDE